MTKTTLYSAYVKKILWDDSLVMEITEWNDYVKTYIKRIVPGEEFIPGYIYDYIQINKIKRRLFWLTDKEVRVYKFNVVGGSYPRHELLYNVTFRTEVKTNIIEKE